MKRGSAAADPVLIVILEALLCRGYYELFLCHNVTGGAVIAVLGVYCVVGVGKPFQITSGMWLIFIAMLTFAASIIMMRKLTERIDPFSATIYSTLIGSGETQTEAIMVTV